MKKTSCSILMAFGFSAFFATSQVSAQPGSGIKMGGNSVLIPSVNLSYNYDDNIALRGSALAIGAGSIQDNVSDEYFSYLASLDLIRRLDNRQLRVNAYYGEDLFQEYSALDSDRYGANFGYLWERPNGNTKVALDGGYEYATDRGNSPTTGFVDSGGASDITTPAERAERDIYFAKTKISQQLAINTGGAFIFGYTDIAYKSENYNDVISYDYALEINHKLSDKTQPYLQGGIGLDDDEGYAEDSEKPYALAGVRYSPTAKLRLNIGVGYEGYDRTPFTVGVDENGFVETDENGDFVLVPGESESDSGFKYNLRITYLATSKSSFFLNGRNGFNSGGQGARTAREENAVSLSYRHATTKTINQSLTISWREDDYLDPNIVNGEEINELKETIRYQYVFNYQTQQPWLSLFANASYEDGNSKLPEQSYHQTELSAGARIRY